MSEIDLLKIIIDKKINSKNDKKYWELENLIENSQKLINDEGFIEIIQRSIYDIY